MAAVLSDLAMCAGNGENAVLKLSFEEVLWRKQGTPKKEG
jgi:hypothetical protein